MSRSALWRQEAGVQERERHAREIFETAVQQGKSRPAKGLISMVIKDEDTFNLHPTLLHSISSSPYFLKLCQNVNDWNALVDEIYYQVQHLEPWMIQGSGPAAHKVPSTAFCILLRLFTIRCTEKQMHLMLNHVDSPYIRCIGFLYLRFVADPHTIFAWFKPYLYDEEPVQVVAPKPRLRNTAEEVPSSNVGIFARFLLQSMEFHGTILPRLPVTVERDIKVQLLQLEDIESRARRHWNDEKIMQYLQTVGHRVTALYQDAENPLAWYDAVIDRVLFHDAHPPSHGQETGSKSNCSSKRPKFIVTFTEYGNTETVSLGEIDVPFQPTERFHNKIPNTHTRGDHDRDRCERQTADYHRRAHEEELRKEVIRRDRDHAIAKGKQYASRPKSVKECLTSVPQHDTHHPISFKRARSPVAHETKASVQEFGDSSQPAPKHKTLEDIAATEEKKRKLLARYG
jgi:pre-mRNA-splicing factor 38B